MYHANKTHFHKKGFALGLVLRVKVFGTRKWSIQHINNKTQFEEKKKEKKACMHSLRMSLYIRHVDLRTSRIFCAIFGQCINVLNYNLRYTQFSV